MTRDDLKYMKQWFSDYTKTFYSFDEEDQKNIMLKVVHTKNVCRNILEIAEGLGLDENRMMLAETAALFHDVGRFPQYAQYKTFRDADSLNHGLLASKTLVEEKVLSSLPQDEQELILLAVKFHNAFEVPLLQNEDAVFFLKLVRDADKLDIFRVFLEYYESPVKDRASATAFGVPDSPECSKEMIASIMEGRIASYSNIRTENDFRLMKLSWVFGLYFDVSLRILNNRGYQQKIAQRLPHTDEVALAIKKIDQYICERLGNDCRK
ncbi:MAG: HD domain-containing protein [Nitrospirota bacterium]|nr:HD domain-containing protein [Nitrospirota bacterium]